jgi:hypothetical protein
MYRYCRLVWMSQTNVPVVLLDPGINGTASLPNVILTTFARYAVHAWSFQSQVVFNWPKKTSNFLCARPTDLMYLDRIRLMRLKVVLTNERRATEVGFSEVVATLFGGSRARRICRSP